MAAPKLAGLHPWRSWEAMRFWRASIARATSGSRASRRLRGLRLKAFFSSARQDLRTMFCAAWGGRQSLQKKGSCMLRQKALQRQARIAGPPSVGARARRQSPEPCFLCVLLFFSLFSSGLLSVCLNPASNKKVLMQNCCKPGQVPKYSLLLHGLFTATAQLFLRIPSYAWKAYAAWKASAFCWAKQRATKRAKSPPQCLGLGRSGF